jgi:hypothetical protein
VFLYEEMTPRIEQVSILLTAVLWTAVLSKDYISSDVALQSSLCCAFCYMLLSCHDSYWPEMFYHVGSVCVCVCVCVCVKEWIKQE